MKLLIVDDQAANRILLSDMAVEFGYRCLTVADGQQALDVFEQFQPDIVLLDVLMPGLDGLKTAPRLKTLAGEVHLPIIFITALDDQKTLLACLEAGGDDFISKPFEPVVLEAKLRAHGRTRELSLSLAEKNASLAYHSSRVEREHRIVEHIFQNSLTDNYLDYPHLSTYLSSMSMFNGDLLLAAPGPLGNMYLMLGDFTGHGLSAAVGALPTAQTFFAMTAQGAAVGELAREINQRLHYLLPDDMFLAALILEISASGERVTYWNGGIPPGLLLQAGAEAEAVLKPQHLALGVLSEREFDSAVSSLRVQPSQSLLLYTDGLTELKSERDGAPSMLGLEGVKALLRDAQNMAQLTYAVQALMQSQPQRDDVSMAWLKCKPTGLVPKADLSPLSALPFSLHIRLGPDEIRQNDPVNQMVRDLTQIQGFSRYKAQLYTVLQETYKNAIEHGLLQLDSGLKACADGFEQYYQLYEERLAQLQSGWVELRIDYHPRPPQLRIQVRDSGQGFCQQAVARNASSEEGFGRGLRLLQELTTDLVWQEQGSSIAFTLPLHGKPANPLLI